MAADRPGFRARLGSVRLRTTLGAVVVVGLALLAGSLALVTLLDRTLTDDVRSSAALRASEVGAQLASTGDPGRLAVADAEEQLIQVIDDTGVVVAASANMRGRPAVAELSSGESIELADLLDDAPFLAVARSANSASGDYTVIVARSLEDARDVVRAVTGLLAVALPVLLVVVAGTTWTMVGRTLRPVEAIRREVEGISGHQLHRRVPQPAASDEIGRLARTMNAMLGRLDESAARQRRFVSDASHELRSPVSTIRQHAEVALAHPGRTTVPELAETVLAEDLRIERLVDDLLLLARSDEGDQGASRVAVDLDDLVYDEARRLRERGTVQVDIAALRAGRITGVPAQLRRLIVNLLDNAARHARTQVAVALGTDPDDGYVVLRVDDDGPGVPAAERTRVFERFVRLDDARARDHGGFGLGLAIVADVARGHGGTVRLGDAPTGGARFEVRLPPHQVKT